MRLCIKAVVVGCSVFPSFLKIKARTACVRELPKARQSPRLDIFEVCLIILIGLIIRKTPNKPVMTASHLIKPILSLKINGDNKVTKIAELWANAVVRPIGISCKEEKTIIIVTNPKQDRSKMFFQLLICRNNFFLAM